MESQPLTTPTSPNVHGALLSRLTSDGAPRHLGPIRTHRTSSKLFERPNFYHIFAHVVVCCAAYPVIYAGAVSAKDKSLFWARVIVGLWCAGVGVVIGWSLVEFARKYIEAASKCTFHVSSSTSWVSRLGSYQFSEAWATVIHLSHSDNGLGIKMKDLAHNAHHPESMASGFKLLWTRFSNRGTDRRSRRTVECVFPLLCRPTGFACLHVRIILVHGRGHSSLSSAYSYSSWQRHFPSSSAVWSTSRPAWNTNWNLIPK